MIAIDYHEKPFYGDKKIREVVGCKRKAGTNYAYKYITASIVEEGVRFNLGCLPVTQFDLEEDLLRTLISKCRKYVEIGVVLLDRGFNSIEDYKLLGEELRLKFIMPQTKNSKLQKMLESKELKVYSQFEYIFNEHRAKEYHYKARMFYITNEKGEKYAFVTNIHTINEELLKLIVQAYDKRWGIETGYRVKHDFLCKTTSKSFSVRTFFAQLAFLLQD
ncbi:MAG: transposase, partial [Nanoarchaeota archaeon]|nr:transposase [Nanoarchaeota archaeon]